MGILSECPVCKTRQSVKNKLCRCGQNMDKAKKSNRVKYWVNYLYQTVNSVERVLASP